MEIGILVDPRGEPPSIARCSSVREACESRSPFDLSDGRPVARVATGEGGGVAGRQHLNRATRTRPVHCSAVCMQEVQLDMYAL